MTKVAAVDIGATSGRVVLAQLGPDGPRLDVIARFPNVLRQSADAWTWDVESLYAGMVDGLVQAVDADVTSWGIDTWALDYGVVRDGALVGPVRAYRDPRHEQGIARVRKAMEWERLYDISGIQHMPINTIYQIAADEPQRITDGTTFLMVPDLLSYWATGVMGTDITNASSTAMVDVRTRQWSPEVLHALGLPVSAFLEPQEPGAIRGPASEPRLRQLPLVAVATHDTASAFVGTPLVDRDTALVLSLGTWALIGAEAIGIEPTPSSMALNVTHELGVDGTVRFLRNVSGMWLLEECRRSWAASDGVEPSVPDLLAAAEAAPALAAVFDVDAPDLVHPGQSQSSIAPHLTGSWDGSRGSVVRVILESLVVRLAQRAAEVEALLGTPRPVLHVVGGASRMSLLMQWLADATGKTVVAGPVEATALGNAIVQWRTMGAVTDLAEARRLVSGMPEIRTFEPRGDRQPWQDLAERLATSEGRP
jgi:rhamnulokinase